MKRRLSLSLASLAASAAASLALVSAPAFATPGFSANPANKAFGNVVPDYASVPQVFTITNPGSSNLTNFIRFEPALPAWRQRMAQDLSQGSVIKCLAIYDEPFWRDEGLSGQGFGPGELVRELYDNSPPSASAGVLVTFLTGERAEEAGRMLPEERREKVLEAMAKYVGDAALEARDFVEVDWSAEEWTRGAYGTSFGPGGLTRFRDDLRRPVGPISWACTDIAGVGHIHMDGAIRSGQAAAQQVLDELS